MDQIEKALRESLDDALKNGMRLVYGTFGSKEEGTCCLISSFGGIREAMCVLDASIKQINDLVDGWDRVGFEPNNKYYQIAEKLRKEYLP